MGASFEQSVALFIGFASKAPVKKADFAELTHIHIVRLDIQMADVDGVGVVDSVAHPLKNAQTAVEGVVTGFKGTVFPNPFQHRGEGESPEIRHGVIGSAVVIHTDIVNSHNIGMVEVGGDPCFTDKLFRIPGRAFLEIGHKGHGDFPVGVPVMDQKNTLHAAETDTADELITLLSFLRESFKGAVERGLFSLFLNIAGI